VVGDSKRSKNAKGPVADCPTISDKKPRKAGEKGLREGVESWHQRTLKNPKKKDQNKVTKNRNTTQNTNFPAPGGGESRRKQDRAHGGS